MKKTSEVTEYLRKHKIPLVDVGSSGGLREPWCDHNDIIDVTSFDPDIRAEHKNQANTVIPMGLYSSKGEEELFVTKNQVLTSLRRPNISELGKFPSSGRFEIINTNHVSVSTLDEYQIKGVRPAFMKIDTQGTEYEILSGADNQLDQNVLGVEVEVNFLERYQGCKLFPDIHTLLTKKGFYLFDLRGSYWKRLSGKMYGGRKGQLIMSDALYLRSEEAFSNILQTVKNKEETVLHMIMISLVYGYVDYGFTIYAYNKKYLGATLQSALDDIFKEKENSKPSMILSFFSRHKISNFALKIHKKTQPLTSRTSWYHIDKNLGNDW